MWKALDPALTPRGRRLHTDTMRAVPAQERKEPRMDELTTLSCESVDSYDGQVVDNDAVEIGTLYADSHSSMIDAVVKRLECGRRLVEKKDYLGHGNWLPWLAENAGTLGFENDSTARRLMKAAQANRALAHDLDDEEAVRLSRQMWGHDKDSATNHLAIGSGENEWYTPQEFIDKARAVMGGIDLDPASSAEANETVGASVFFTENEDGLSQHWEGKIWLNPPYSRDLMPKFCEKLAHHVDNGDVESAMLVAHNNTDTAWFHRLSQSCAAACFPSRRIRFYRGDDVAAPVNGQVFFYFGDDIDSFKREFGSVGWVVVSA